MEAVCRPIYKRTPIVELCRERQTAKREEAREEMHPFSRILANELRELFDTSKMILICHKNSINAYDLFNFRVALHREGVSFTMRGKKIVEAAIGDSKFRTLLPLFRADNCMLFSQNTNVDGVLKVMKKTPQVLLLAGVVEDRILSRSQLEEYANMHDLDTVRAQFAATLFCAGNQIVSNLQAHQSNLCYLLDAHSQILSEGKSKEPNPTEQATEQKDDK